MQREALLRLLWPWGRTTETREHGTRHDPYVTSILGPHPPVGAASADCVLSNSAVAARCVALRSELLASVPLFLFRRTDDGGRERADSDPLYDVLHDAPNPIMTAFEFRELMIRSLDLYGNAFARIERNGRGQVVALWPLSSRSMGIEMLANGRLRYKWSDDRGMTRILLQEEVLHLRGPSKNGIVGQSPIQIARGSLSLSLAQTETAQAMATNGFRTSGYLSHPAKLSPAAHTNIKDTLSHEHGGARNAGKLLILEEGMVFKEGSFSPEDSEFLESRKLSNEDVARVFGVPPTACGILDRGTYSNVEQEARALVQNCLGPLAVRIEAGLQRCLLTENGRRAGMYCEHELAGLLRGDVASRFNAYRVAREIGAMSANDVRRLENAPPIPNGDMYNQPANWIPLGTDPPQTTGSASNV